MNLSEREMFEKIRKSLSDGLQGFVGRKSKRSLKEEISLATQKMLANMEADLYGYEINQCDTLWNTFSLKEKAKWLLYNVLIPSKGEAVRLRIDLENEKARYEQFVEEMNAQEDAWPDDQPEELHWSWLERKQYPDYAARSPKSIITVKTTIRPKKAMEFIPLSIQLKDVKADNE